MAGEVVESVGPCRDPIDDCDGCHGNGIRVDGKCLLHHIASKHSVGEFRKAVREVKKQHNVFERAREAENQFKERAEAAFEDRYIAVRHPSERETYGENIAWMTRESDSNIFHADKHCPNLTDGWLKAMPMGYARTSRWKHPCDRCTVREGNDD